MARRTRGTAEAPIKAVYVVPSHYRAIRQIAADRDAKISEVAHELIAEALRARERHPRPSPN